MDTATRSVRRAATLSDARWAAVLARDAAADGIFFYAVRTTGVYCRPSCGARAPRPENVVFHPSAAAAEAAGFRPCRRCRPEAPALAARLADKVAQACRLIEAAQTAPHLAALAAQVGLSPGHLHRTFKTITGVTPRAYAAAHRAQRVCSELARGAPVTDALYAAGYGSSGRFYEAAPGILGMAPKDYRAGGTAATIRFAIGSCSLGCILVAASDVGVCAIFLGDDPDALARDLRGRFPRANLIGGDAAFEALVAKVVGFVEAPQRGLDLPLDLRGTAFQLRVWQALQAIPPGRTASYSEIARRVGAPQSVRAVAGACAANLLAVAIPCHRVVRIDGGLSVYRWGVERKRALIDRESEA